MYEQQEERYRNDNSKKAISVFRNIFQQGVYDLVQCDKYMYDKLDVWLKILCGYLPSMVQEIRGGLPKRCLRLAEGNMQRILGYITCLL